MIPSYLLQAYLNTEYRITDPPLSIRIGDLHPDLDKLLDSYGCSTYAFITAHNPSSQVLSDSENITRHQMLFADLAGYPCFEGYGIGTDPDWKPEQSLLVLGFEQGEASAIGIKYGQNAIVTGRAGEVATLVLLQPSV